MRPRPEMNNDPTLTAFKEDDALRVARWARSAGELDAWASRSDHPIPASVIREWHTDPDVLPFVLRSPGGEPRAYGEIWLEPGSDEAELARMIVAPGSRGRGIGRTLVRLLCEEASRRGPREMWIRVLPSNDAAIACYRSAGFLRASKELEAELNSGQPRIYQWMRSATDLGA